jgi:L-malate glycosyltransferase
VRGAIRYTLAVMNARRRPTICHVLHSLHIGGGELLARDIARAHESEYRPIFALLDDLGRVGRELQEQGYVVEVVGRRDRFDPRCAWRLRQVLIRERAAVIHAHQYGPLLYSAIARLPSGQPPIVFHEHGRHWPDYRRPKRVLANRILLRPRDRFVAVGEAVRRALVEFEGLPEARVRVIYNGINLAPFDPARSMRARVRVEHGWPEHTRIVMQVARLNRLKDHATSMRAIAQLAGAVPNCRLVFVGEGEEEPALRALHEELRLGTQVEFLGARSDVPRLLHAADAFLLTSITEGIPLTLIEAMAAGLPCVATAVGGVPEVLVDGVTGLLAPAGDPSAIADGLRRILCDPLMATRLGQAGRERAAHHFAIAPMQAQYAQIYGELCGVGPQGR